MKNVVTKTLIGSAVLAACGLANAATTNVVATASSTEANVAAVAANASASVALPAMTFTLAGTGYADGDVVTFSVSGGSLRTSSVGAVDDKITCTGQKEVAGAASSVNALELTVTEITSTSVKFSVARLDNAVVIAGRTTGVALSATTCTLQKATGATPYELLASSLTSPTTVRVNWSAATSGGSVHDSLTNVQGNPASTAIVHRAATQFLALAGGPDASMIISPSSAGSGLYPAQTTWQDSCGSAGNRRSLAVVTAGTAPSAACNANRGSGYAGGDLDAEIGVIITDHNGSVGTSSGGLGTAQGNRLATADNVVISWTGDFSFLDNNGDGCTLADVSQGWGRVEVRTGRRSTTAGTAARTVGTPVAISASCNEIQTTGSYTPGALFYQYLYFSVGNGADTTLSTNGARVIPVQTVVANATFRASSTVVGTAAAAVASFSLDSQSADINYMPYGAGISRIVYVTSAASSPVTITAVNESGTSCASTNFPAVSVVASRPTSLSTAMDSGVATCYGSAYTGKVKFTVTLAAATARGQYSLRLSEMEVTPRATATTATTTYGNVSFAAGVRDAAATVGAGEAATIAAQTGTISRIADTFEIYSAYNVNGNRVQVTNQTNGR